MLQLRKTSNQRTNSQVQNEVSGDGGMIPMTILENPSSNANNPPLIGQLQQQQQQLQQQYDEVLNNPINLEWINKPFVQKIVRVCALCSFVSICANTPETFKIYKWILILTYVVDLISTSVFTVEMIAKIKTRGLFKGESAYLFDRWCQFDGTMVLFHLVSLILQVYFLKFILIT